MLLFLFAAFFNSSANFLTKLMGHLTPVIQNKNLALDLGFHSGAKNYAVQCCMVNKVVTRFRDTEKIVCLVPALCHGQW